MKKVKYEHQSIFPFGKGPNLILRIGRKNHIFFFGLSRGWNPCRLGTADGLQVEIQDDIQVQEVEIEQIPMEMPIETVETEETIEVQPVIALQPLPEPASEEIVPQTSEEVVGADSLDYVDTIPVPVPEVEIATENESPRRGKGGKKKGRGRNVTELVVN